MKITIFGEKYSDNLGDGVISDCLVYAFASIDTSFIVSAHDLSMREGFSFSHSVRSDVNSSSLSILIRRFKKLIGWELVRSKEFKTMYCEVIKSSDIVLIGGGQIFLDNELNFPVKIRALSKILNTFGISHAFVCCGVSGRMSFIGATIFKKVLTNRHVKSLIVRDLLSLKNAKNILEYETPVFLIDPAIITSNVYSVRGSVGESTVKKIGMNIMDFETLSKCFGYRVEKDAFYDIWVDLVHRFVEDGFTVVLHTNGASEDNYALSTVRKRIGQLSNVITMIPKSPKDLADIIASVNVLIAYRLHANIMAFSLGIPSVGVVWDEKVSEFSAISGRQDFYIREKEMNVNIFYEYAHRALLAGVDNSKVLELKKQFIAGIERFVVSLR